MEGAFYGYLRTRTSVIWPHELFAAIYEFHPHAFGKYILGGGPHMVQQFWRTMPCRSGLEAKVGYQRWCIPLGLHGDGVAVSNIRGSGSKVADTLSWTSLLSTAATRLSSYRKSFVENTAENTKTQSWKSCGFQDSFFGGVWVYDRVRSQACTW